MTKNMNYKLSPLICVCGATGTGKSKMGVQLAKALNGEIINADAVQLYDGLDIATNKVVDLKKESHCYQ